MYRLRFIKLIFFWFFSKKGALLDEYKLNFRAWPLLDCDVSRMFTQSYTALMGLGRFQLVFYSEFRHSALKKGWFPITTSESVKYIRPINVFDKVTLKTRILCWNEKYFYAKQEFYVKNKIKQTTLVEGLLRDIKGPLNPKEVFKELGVDYDSPPTPTSILHWLESKKALLDENQKS